MADQKKTILIVDDQPVDCAMIQIAVQSCLQLLGKDSQFEIKLVSNPKKAVEIARARPAPALIITDLFMPDANLMKDGEFSSLPLGKQCDEMEFPHGLDMLTQLKSLANVRKLVTTFFWNYPGFSRYTDCIYRPQHALADGALPKDIFFLVAGLSIGNSRHDVEHYPPLRILVQALGILLGSRLPTNQPHSTYFRSLFDESSSWLIRFPHYVLDLRKSIVVVQKKAGSGQHLDAREAPLADYDPWDNYDEIVNHGQVSPWLPRFVFHSSIGGLPYSKGIYKRIIKEIEGREWRMEIEMPAVHTPSAESSILTRTEFTLDGELSEVKHPSRAFGSPSITFLNPKSPARAEHRKWAQLLVTLGFFSYWCHLPDHRAIRTPEEIDEIIRMNTGKPYGDLETACSRMYEDIELLEIVTLQKLRKARHDAFFRFFILNRDLTIIGHTRLSSNKTGYWLNASLVLHGT